MKPYFIHFVCNHVMFLRCRL